MKSEDEIRKRIQAINDDISELNKLFDDGDISFDAWAYDDDLLISKRRTLRWVLGE